MRGETYLQPIQNILSLPKQRKGSFRIKCDSSASCPIRKIIVSGRGRLLLRSLWEKLRALFLVTLKEEKVNSVAASKIKVVRAKYSVTFRLSTLNPVSNQTPCLSKGMLAGNEYPIKPYVKDNSAIINSTIPTGAVLGSNLIP
ncbi:hypothetical protein J6590_083872 [Homalodisca vitripennis]|nr:hypothetical protein J6590_083872 [Homalodisca vitripennis]